MNKEQIGLRIKLERTKQNLTQEQLAEMADISSSFLTHEPESRYGMEEKPAGTDKMAVSNVERKRKMAELEEMISSRNDREFNLIYDEVALFISKLQYFGDRR